MSLANENLCIRFKFRHPEKAKQAFELARKVVEEGPIFGQANIWCNGSNIYLSPKEAPLNILLADVCTALKPYYPVTSIYENAARTAKCDGHYKTLY